MDGETYLPIVIFLLLNAGINCVIWTIDDDTGKSYALMNKEKKDWADALEVCQTHDASLVSIDSEEEQLLVKELQEGQPVWTSGSDRNKEKEWAWYTGFQQMVYTNWSTNEQNGPDKNCILMENSGAWIPANCLEKFAFICQKQGESHDICDSNWTVSYTTSKCYRKLDTAMDWTSALIACQRQNANLISIEDEDEEGLIEYLFQEKHIWTSGTSVNKEGKWIFVGASGSTSYTNWISKRYKKNYNRGKYCIAVKRKNVRGPKPQRKRVGWVKLKCKRNIKPVCEKSTMVIPIAAEENPHLEPGQNILIPPDEMPRYK